MLCYWITSGLSVSPAVFQFLCSWYYWQGTNIVGIRSTEFIFATSSYFAFGRLVLSKCLCHSKNIIQNWLHLWSGRLENSYVIVLFIEQINGKYICLIKVTTNKNENIPMLYCTKSKSKSILELWNLLFIILYITCLNYFWMYCIIFHNASIAFI